MCCKPVATEGKPGALSGKDLREYSRETNGTDCPHYKGEANLARFSRLSKSP